MQARAFLHKQSTIRLAAMVMAGHLTPKEKSIMAGVFTSVCKH